jgi:prefoldin subunit 5
MSRIVEIKGGDLVNLIKTIIFEETEGDDQYYDITPDQYYMLLRSVNYQAQAIPKLPMFKGKKLRVNGPVNINGKPIKSLGEITINGQLTIAGTQIKSLNGVEYNSLGAYYNTPYAEEIERRKRQKERDDADQRRIDDEWNLNDTDNTGERAHAIFRFMVNEGDIDELEENEIEELKSLEQKLQELEDRIDVEEDPDLVDELTNDYDELQYDIDELKSKNNDVYGLIPLGSHYEMDTFRSIHPDADGHVYAVGTEYDADTSLQDYYKDMIDDLSNFSKDTLSYHIDGDDVAEYFEDMIREGIYDDPSNYDLIRDISGYQEQQIDDLKFERVELQGELFLINYGIIPPLEFVVNRENNWEYKDGAGNKINLIANQDGSKTVLLNGTPTLKNPVYKDIDWDEMSENIAERISEIEDRFVDIEDDIETIKDNPEGDPDEDDVEREVEERLDEIKDDPIRWLDDYGVDYENFVDKRSLEEDLIRDSDYSILANYDGTYDEIRINDTNYVVFRVD